MPISTKQFMHPVPMPPYRRDEMHEAYYRDVLGGDKQLELDIMNSLLAYFLENDVEIDYEYADSYFLWFTDLVWRNLGYIPKKHFYEVVTRTAFVAILLDFDVLDQMLLYLQGQTLEPLEVELIYDLIRTHMIQSRMVLGIGDRGTIRFADIANLINVDLDNPAKEALEYIDANVKETKYDDGERYLVRYRQAVVRLVDFVSYLIIVPVRRIWYVVDTYHREAEAEDRKARDDMDSPTGEALIIDQVIEEHLSRLGRAATEEHPEDESPSFETLLSKNSTNLKTILMQTPTLQAALAWLSQYEDRAEAWRRLIELLKTHAMRALRDDDVAARVIEFSDFLQANGYEGQPDLVYYDEATGRFMWHS